MQNSHREFVPLLHCWRGTFLILLILCISAGCSREDVYPSRPIELICPWPAGGGTDRLARQVAHQLERELHVPVNVINAVGGNGVTGHTRGALSDPHGYAITLATVELNMLHWRGLTSLNADDFLPLCLLNRDAAAIFVREESPYKTIQDLEDAIRNSPVPMKSSGTSQGGVWHAAVVGWLVEQKISPSQVTWISIAGSTASLQELVAGGIDFACCSVPEAAALHDAGKIRCLGVMSESPHISGLPTFRDAGIPWSLGGWRGIVAPKSLPPERRDRLCDALEKICHSDEFADFMDRAGFDRSYAGFSEFTGMLKDWDRDLGEILTSDAFTAAQQPRFGPMFFPKILGGGLLILGLALFVTGQFKTASGAVSLNAAAILRLAIVPAWVAGYALLSPTLGFVLTASLLLLGALLALRVSPRTAVPVTLLTVPAVYQLFAVILHVSLPWGWIGW